MNNITFTGDTPMVRRYLQRKAVKAEQDLADAIKYAGRAIISKNQRAAQTHGYIPVDAYFGNVPMQPRAKSHGYVAADAYFGPAFVQATAKKQEIIPQNSINFFG